MSIRHWYKANLNALDRKHGLDISKAPQTDEELREIQRKTFEALRGMAVGVETHEGWHTLKFERNGETLEADFDKDYNNIFITA